MIFVHDVDRLCAAAGHFRVAEILDDFRSRLHELSRHEDTVAQLSDRKFVLLLSEFRNQGHVQLAAQKIQRLLEASSDTGTGHPALQAAIGIVLVPAQYGSAKEVLRFAEIALLDGRRNKRPITFYQAQAADRMISEWNLEQRFADAIEVGSLELHYQPKLHLGNMRVTGAEALVRWHDPVLGEISPDVFIDVAEHSGLIPELTQFSLQRACHGLNEWRQSLPDLTIAVNITPTVIGDLEIVDLLASATRIWNLDADAVVLEVTENALMIDPEASRRILAAIRDFGAGVSIDDFGTGYSSLAYLRDIPADELKIDRSFVTNMRSDPGDRKIVEHAISIAKSFDLRVVAEGVPDGETMNDLRALGCDYAQGHHICEPLPAAEFLAWCLEWNRRPR
jgi:EAL domain-containing protein (putative c-di-GMP-specific phosphodiesterase class I)